MITGDTIVRLINLETDAGLRQSYASKAAFQAIGWDLTWRDTTGAALSSQPTWTLAAEGNGIHRVEYTMPASVWWVEITVPTGYRADPSSWSGEGLAYDAESLAGLINTSSGVPGILSADDSNFGDVVMGDAWNSGTLYIPLAKLSRLGYGYSDLASGWTFTAGFKDAPATTVVNTGVTAVAGATIATDGAISFGFTTFPTAMNLSSTAEQLVWYADVQLKKTSNGIIITALRGTLTVKWQRDTVT